MKTTPWKHNALMSKCLVKCFNTYDILWSDQIQNAIQMYHVYVLNLIGIWF